MFVFGDNLLLRNFRPYGIMFMMCATITVVMIMLLKDFGYYGIIFMTKCVYLYTFSYHSWRVIC
jgi:hypothetical protein